MEEPLRPGMVRLRVHGRPSVGTRDIVDATVFARKLAILIQAIRAATSVYNRRAAFDYAIVGLRRGSATVEVEEIPRRPSMIQASGVEAFELCVNAVYEGNFERARGFGRCPEYLEKLSRGANEQFGYGELWINGHTLVRVDSFLQDQGRAAMGLPPKVAAPEEPNWFRGIARSSFVGQILEADFRGALPQGKLILAAGGREIDCVFRDIDVEELRNYLKGPRVRVEGRAIYDGKFGLPRRVEVSLITPLIATGDFARWKGSFDPFDVPAWEESDL